jgi:asparagine synthase (glutamine-hydrolysing)
MCGFVAIIGPGAPVPRPILERMRDRLAHRGPDGEGVWQSTYERGNVSLGFRRLAIIDTRHVADQPMVSSDGRRVIVFNGEIYNFVELRAELEATGRVFRTRSDTEVLLQAYEHWGEAVVERLNGMFAIVIWNETKNQVFIARDRLGEKPLFTCRLPDGKLAFASEIKALLAHPEVDASYDLEIFGSVLGGHLLFGTDETLFKHVRQFRAAHCMTLSVSGEIIREHRYWTPRYDRSLADVSFEELTHRLRDHLERSLVMRMRSDVPVTACLSGGLDSSSLVALLAGLPENEVGRIRSVISVRFPDDPTIDEGRFIDMVLQRTGLEGHTVTPTPEDMMRDLRQLHWHHETIIPGPSMYLEWSLMRQARALGYKVIIDGQGADELFAGYQSYLQSYQVELAHKGVFGLLRAMVTGRQRDRRLRQAAQLYKDPLRRFSLRDSLPMRMLYTYPRYHMTKMVREYGNDGLPSQTREGALRFDLALNLLRTSLPSNLYSGDRNSMAHGIECRYPFLDYLLVDFATRLPDEAYLGQAWSKMLLRRSMQNLLPDAVQWRVDKVGFAAPQDVWLRTPAMKSWIEERIHDAALEGIPGYSDERIFSAFTRYQTGTSDETGVLWQWASAAELLDLGRQKLWSEGHVS